MMPVEHGRSPAKPEAPKRLRADRAAARFEARSAHAAERERARQFQEDGLDWMEGRDTPGAARFTAAIEAKREAVKASRAPVPSPHARVMRQVRKAERVGGDGTEHSGTGFTVLKHRLPPVAKLVETGKLGPEGLDAAREIERAFFALTRRLMVKGGLSLDRVDGGGMGTVPAAAAHAVAAYQSWANHWSRRRKMLGDPMLEVVIAAVIDERPVREIALDVGRRHSTVERGLVAGLQDYAARTGVVGGKLATSWIAQAAAVFKPGNPVLVEAIRRAAIEV